MKPCRRGRSAVLALALLLAACAMPNGTDGAPGLPPPADARDQAAGQAAQAGQERDATSGRTTSGASISGRPISDKAGPGRVQYACTTDAECVVKDIGNCCGYYPACVNRDSPTFPEQVRAACAKSGQAGICGFPVIDGCACEAGVCKALTAKPQK